MKIKKYFDKIIIIFLATIFILVGYFNKKNESDIDNNQFLFEETKYHENNSDIDKLKESVIETISEEIYVDISGCIINPGVYKLRDNQRIIDAIDIAGGLCPDAETSNINFAKKLFDEMKIYIRKVGETNNEMSSDFNNDLENITNNFETNDSGKININTANKEQLMKLPGIGDKRAIEIINYRENKKFRNIEDIKNISGIGDKTFEKIKELIIVN
ncbi:MAG: ComEA family DNA-binding protein [Helcococcus sp.]|nr:ComEA family DNA-binding protein [Helcococcus sp.]